MPSNVELNIFSECQDGTYGTDCFETCSTNCFNQTCNTINGECLLECNNGWLGFNCTKSLFLCFQRLSPYLFDIYFIFELFEKGEKCEING